MRKFGALFIAALTALVLTACGGSSPREEPFVGQWESTGGSQLSLTVAAPADGKYPVTFSGGDVRTEMTATEVSDGTYQAEPQFVWTFTMVDDDLMNVQIEGGGDAKTTSFKRIGD
ncbi:MAG: hypothetical protein R2720_01575 [Candidatus Nanopelagicales bacterium]